MLKKYRSKGLTLVELPVARRRGFTLIELLIVIAIIAILATIVVVSYIGAQAKSRDNKRKADVQIIASAYQIYNQETKTWYISGTGSGGGGQGWFNYENGTTYPKSMAHGLEDGGYLNPAPRDPQIANDTTITPSNGARQYIKYQFACINGNKSTIYAKLESPTDEEIADAREGCSSTVVDGYGMNYGVNLK